MIQHSVCILVYFGSLQWKSSVDTVDAAEFPPSTCCSDNFFATQVKESRFDEGKSHATQPKHPERGSHGEHERHGQALERKGSETLRQWQSLVQNPGCIQMTLTSSTCQNGYKIAFLPAKYPHRFQQQISETRASGEPCRQPGRD